MGSFRSGARLAGGAKPHFQIANAVFDGLELAFIGFDCLLPWSG
jgi:hypothetical protein